MARLSSFDIDLGSYFKLKFLTPTLLSNKLLMPPKANKKLRRSLVNMLKLFPTPFLLTFHLVCLWNRNFGPELTVPKPTSDHSTLYYALYMGRIADMIMLEVDYDIRLATILYDENRSIGMGLLRWRGLAVKAVTLANSRILQGRTHV